MPSKKNIRKQHENACKVVAQTAAQSIWEFYYWNETDTNPEGESLRTCMERYGVGGWYSKEKDMVAALVFKSAEKTAGNSWLLGLKRLNNEQAEVRMYEENPFTYHLPLDTTLGANITMLLASSAFEKL